MKTTQHCLLLAAGFFLTTLVHAQSSPVAEHFATLKETKTSNVSLRVINAVVEETQSRSRLALAGDDTLLPAPRQEQERQWSFFVESRATATTNNVVPFWMRSNQYGSVPPAGVSGSLIGRVARDYKAMNRRFLDWGMALEGRANGGEKSNATLIEGYAKIKLGPFSLRGGRVKEFIGLIDSTLSTGAFSISGNALGIPKAEIYVPEFFPFLGGKLFAFQGNLAHGWLGETTINKPTGNRTFERTTVYFHQKSFYGRFGKPEWRIRLYGGFNHEVFWGSEKIRYGSWYTLSNWETYLYVLQGKKYDGTSSKIGNQLGSIDVGLEYNTRNLRLFFYRQSFYDIGGLYHLANVQDGLHGLSITNKANSTRFVQWKKIVFEFLTTKNQGGEPWSPDTKSGAENYYNNSEFPDGWSYQRVGLGNPFLSTRLTTRKGFASSPYELFINNRVSVFHLASEGRFSKFDYKMKLSFSKNFGNWITNSFGRRTGGSSANRIPPVYGIFKEVNQFSSYLEVLKQFKKGVRFGGVLAIDKGDLLYNSLGVQIMLSKTF
jgi:hypothetical protein